MNGRITISVTNDLSNDQRVHKMCTSLAAMGWSVCLVGRLLPNSAPLQRSYETKRLKLWFNRGPLFYAEMNLRLFLFLFLSKSHILHSNDLDTLLPNFLVSKLRSIPLIYDTHEYFLGVPEIQNKVLVKWIWKKIESSIFPRLQHVFTVNESIANLYESDYGLRPVVVRNIPTRTSDLPEAEDRKKFGWQPTDFIFINQGTGINVDRGMEEFLEAMKTLPYEIKLIIVGKGDVVPALKKKSEDTNLYCRIQFIDPVPYEQMLRFTAMADVGLSLDKDTNINYRFSLPNKLFDYIRMGRPILASNLIEVAQVVEGWNLGQLIKSHSVEDISTAVLKMKEEGTEKYREGLKKASRELSWEKEVESILAVYEGII